MLYTRLTEFVVPVDVAVVDSEVDVAVVEGVAEAVVAAGEEAVETNPP